MPKKQKGPTIPELQKGIRMKFKDWDGIRRRGAADPSWPDGMNMNLIRNQVSYEQEMLRKLCKAQKLRPCPVEAKLKPPRKVSDEYCAPHSRSRPCKERRAAARRKKVGKR